MAEPSFEDMLLWLKMEKERLLKQKEDWNKRIQIPLPIPEDPDKREE